MAIYEYKKEDAYRFADSQPIHTKVKGNELTFQFCPYCKGGKNRNKGTFSINLTTGQFTCLRGSCGQKGNMITLSRDFGFELSEDVSRYFNINNYNNRFKSFKDAHKVHESKPAAITYLHSRGISENIARKYEITTKPDEDNILIFPFKDETGEMKFVKYRNTTYVKGSSGGKEWCEANCMPILFGMNHCTGSGTLVITEGQLDSLSLAECGVENAVSVPTGKNGFTWIPHCWDWVNQFEELVIFGDCENGQISLAKMISSRFPQKSRIARVEDYRGYKDANEILQNLGKAAVLDVIKNAEPVISKKIKRMELVEAVDVESMPCVSTGVLELDKILSGGFHFGQVALLSGKRGNGKSTEASQLMVEALNQNINCMIYSGELPDFFVKSWLDRQIYGKRTLTNTQVDSCNSWYKQRLFIYDNTCIDEEETATLLDVIEEAAQKMNVRFFVLDNLMTALDDCSNNESLYRAQSNFVGKLAKMAKSYDIFILLVAHPRKSLSSRFENDDVSGSADITNKVDIVMSYDRILEKDGTELEADRRSMTVTKNRLTGRLGDVTLFYSEDSKRIVGPDRNFQKRYIDDGWDGFQEIEEEDIPF